MAKKKRRNPAARATQALEFFSVDTETESVSLLWLLPREDLVAKGEEIVFWGSGDVAYMPDTQYVFDDVSDSWALDAEMDDWA